MSQAEIRFLAGVGASRFATALGLLVLMSAPARFRAPAEANVSSNTVRIAACQARSRVIEYRLKRAEVLAPLDKNLSELEAIVDNAGVRKCDALVLPEDTPGLMNWLGMHESEENALLPQAVTRMLEHLGRAAARNRMYLVCCSDHLEADGGIYNTAFLLGRDGKEIGRYHKVCPVYHELLRKRGTSFPVFPTPDLGSIGMLICYDLVIPETARCLALQGADIIFFPTMGGGAIGDGDIGVQALRVRAVENFIWLVVAQRGKGAMIISPQGKIVAQAEGPDGLAIADIDPRSGREGGDALNSQRDMRARLFRERNPAAFGILTDPEPPVLRKVPIDLSPEEAYRIASRVLTVGEAEFNEARALARAGRTNDAVAAFAKLRGDYRDSWIDRSAQQHLAALQPAVGEATPRQGLAAQYPGDRGIEGDPRVLFAETFQTSSIADLAKRWSNVSNKDGKVLDFSADTPPGSAARRSLQMTAVLGANTGGHLYKRLDSGIEKLYARFYVKFAEDAGYTHHFVAVGGYNPPTGYPQGGAGERPRGDDHVYIGIEPNGDYGRIPPPGAWSFYTYWREMKISADGKYWGNAISPELPLRVPGGRWQCVEVFARLNSAPDVADGELALWLDGCQVMRVAKGVARGPWSGMGFKLPETGGEPFEGFRWRSSDALKLNFFWLLDYITENAIRQNHVSGPNPVHRVWFNNIVLATEYIGPIRPVSSERGSAKPNIGNPGQP